MTVQLIRVWRTFRSFKLSHCRSLFYHRRLPSPKQISPAISIGVSRMSTGATETVPLNVDYEGLLKAQKDHQVLIIDVREQKEIDETGKLPGSIHIPMGNVSKVLETLAENEFKKQYEKPKPQKDTKIILSCRAGMRSAKVQEELQKLGYQNAWNYVGGWGEWESKQKS
ncbi:heat shock protein 67B2 isoform X2 [Fopius arisanus]|uniref:Heat shock protein 67B2 isoform X2 n=1 Tax=Fopius arisanus TaxID=64838 RepID=A0A9R1TAD7_9HYME|nr:PREDICTED: heat shock protein 67B2-like isoform X2 [Fopius arisanus]